MKQSPSWDANGHSASAFKQLQNINLKCQILLSTETNMNRLLENTFLRSQGALEHVKS